MWQPHQGAGGTLERKMHMEQWRHSPWLTSVTERKLQVMSLKGEKQILLKILNYENLDIMNSPETALVWQPDNNVEYPTMTQVLY